MTKKRKPKPIKQKSNRRVRPEELNDMMHQVGAFMAMESNARHELMKDFAEIMLRAMKALSSEAQEDYLEAEKELVQYISDRAEVLGKFAEMVGKEEDERSTDIGGEVGVDAGRNEEPAVNSEQPKEGAEDDS